MSEQPDRYYRVSVKALVVDKDGRILVCKEGRPNWSLPGGGIDHGEQPLETLARELDEELGIKEIVHAEISSSCTFYAEIKQAWFMWLVYAVKLKDYDFIHGDLVEEAAFIDPETFKGGNRVEMLVYNSWLAYRDQHI